MIEALVSTQMVALIVTQRETIHRGQAKCAWILDPQNFKVLYACSFKVQILRLASLAAQTVKNLPDKAGDPGSILWSERSPGEGNGNPLQYKESHKTK